MRHNQTQFPLLNAINAKHSMLWYDIYCTLILEQ